MSLEIYMSRNVLSAPTINKKLQLVTPKAARKTPEAEFWELAESIRLTIAKTGATPEQVLASLPAVRDRLYQERYGTLAKTRKGRRANGR
jgi:hypothetical protein